jgi:hypothetical protein
MEEKVFHDDIDIDQENDVQESTDSQDKDAEIAKLRAIAQRRKEQLDELKAKADKEPELQVKKEAPLAEDKKLERLELKVEGYKDNEIDFLMEYGGKRAVTNPIIKQALANLREQEQAELATQGEGSTKSGTRGGYAPEDLNKMPIDELIKLAKKEAK